MVSIAIYLSIKYDIYDIIYDIIVHDEILQSIFGSISYIFSTGVIVC